MDCRKAESAVAQDGEIVCTYSGDEAVLFVDFDKQSKRVSSKNFEIMGLVGWFETFFHFMYIDAVIFRYRQRGLGYGKRSFIKI